MSSRISGAIWELDLPHEQMLVLHAIADHADHWGRHVRAEIAEIAWKTGYSRRQIIRVISDLENNNLLTLTQKGGGRGQINEWDINMENGVKKSPFIRKCDKMSPFEKHNTNNELEEKACQNVTDNSGNSVKMSPFTGNSVKMSQFPEQNRDIMSQFPVPSPPDPLSQDLKTETKEKTKEKTLPPNPPPKGGAGSKPKGSKGQRTAYSPGFEMAWRVYPSVRKEGKVETFAIWMSRDLEPRASEIAEKIERLALTLWKGREKHYIPLPTTWFNKERYEDDLIPLTLGHDNSNQELEDLVLGRNTDHSVWSTPRRHGTAVASDTGTRRQGRLSDGSG
jgi:hypothetical protein